MANESKNVFFDFKKFLQDKLGENYEVTDELNNDWEAKLENPPSDDEGNPIQVPSTAVVIRAKAGDVFTSSAQLPYQLDIITNDPKGQIDFFTKFVKEINNVPISSIVEDEPGKYVHYTIVPVFTTPVSMDNNIDFGNGSYSRLVCFATLFVMFNINNISALKIDGELQEILDGSISYVAELFSVKESGATLNKQVKRTATTSLQFSTLNKNNIFAQKCAKIRQGKLTGNEKFEVVVTLTNGSEERYTMIVSQSVLSFARGALPGLNVTLILADQ